ncbi:MAG: double-strand break repair protein AddB [Alphaproteobacteria bacterium]|nr:double-strand break repair protein AddB [Alphaproteobacteria bacterium]
MAGGDPLVLPRITVLLPTRRAVRSLRDAFLRVAPDGKVVGTPLLLPRMRPIGDLASDELSLSDAGEEDLAVPPPIPELRRRLLLTRLVLHWGERRGEEPLLPGQAAALAASLARLLDRVATEGASFAKIADLAPEGLAEHWRVVHEFLEILPQHWPRILAEEEALDAASRRNRLLEQQTAAWRRSPPRHPVIAAGLIGGIPAMTELLSLVAALEEGAVILPGLDRERDAAEWSAIEEDEAHPQHLMAGLLRALELTPAEVRDWPPRRPDPIPGRGFESLSDLPLFASLSRSAGEPAERDNEGAIARRVRLIAEALRPAVTTDAWRRLPAQRADTLGGLSRYDCASAQEEAVTIALLLRRKLETPGATAALVTPDRALARRVAAELRRWDIDIDDSAGLPLNRTPPGVVLRLVLDLAASRLAPVPLLAALKHPLASGGLAPVAFRDLARRLEQAIRGPRPAPGFAGLRAALAGEKVPLARFVDRLEACLGLLPELLVADAVPLSHIAAAHVEAAERLAATATETGGERLWHEAAGEVAARFCHELIDAARDFPPLPGRHYPALFEALAADAVVRPVHGRHPRLAIWGLLEARLQQADLVVLGGLNEGSWPPSAEHDPWMSRQMRREFGIALPERTIGIAAHDFAQALGAPEVALTRAARSEGVPTVPSRWLLRLDTVLQAVGLDGAIGPDDTLRHAAGLIDRAEGYRPLPPPEPRPPLGARPRKLSVTQIETWLRDPYAIYARHILGLRPLEELDADPGRAERGTVIHQTLDAFYRRFPRGMPDNAEEELLRIGREQFGPVLSRPGAWAFWWPRFARIARWLVNQERVRRLDITESLSECEGSWTLGAHGGPFTITAKADRIDRLAEGGFLLIDYKTGSVPPPKQVQTGFAPQLPLEGAILRHGGFKGVSGSPAALEYWRLSGGEPAGERCPIDAGDPGALIDRAVARVEALINRFDDPATPYLAVPSPRWAPRYSDYRHLERLAESEVEE